MTELDMDGISNTRQQLTGNADNPAREVTVLSSSHDQAIFVHLEIPRPVEVVEQLELDGLVPSGMFLGLLARLDEPPQVDVDLVLVLTGQPSLSLNERKSNCPVQNILNRESSNLAGLISSPLYRPSKLTYLTLSWVLTTSRVTGLKVSGEQGFTRFVYNVSTDGADAGEEGDNPGAV